MEPYVRTVLSICVKILGHRSIHISSERTRLVGGMAFMLAKQNGKSLKDSSSNDVLVSFTLHYISC